MSDDEVHSVSGNMDASDSASIATVNSSKSETPSVAAASKKRKSTKKKSDGYSRPKKRTKAAAKEEEEEEYEVEMIVDHKLEDDKEYYLVKWKGWSEDHDSWVPKEDLNCQALVAEYFKKLQSAKVPSISAAAQAKKEAENAELQTYIEGILQPTNEDIETAIQLVCAPPDKSKGSNGYKSNMSSDDLNKFAVMVFKKKQKLAQMEKSLMMQLLTRDFRLRRIEQLRQLKKWQDEINEIAEGRPPVKVENNVDLDEPPVGFTYITQCKAGEGVVIPDDPVIGCECADCIDGRKTCCGPMSGTQCAYTKAGRLRVEAGTPIYECNKRCKCGPECANRVVQRGSKLKLCIFRTSNGRGWGVKALEPIKKNTFVIEYVGEIILNEEAERRGMQYDAEGRTYLFDLDFNDTDSLYAIDAAHIGNISHFINHSCDPNLAVFAIWADCMDPNMPRLALFAQRDIHTGEELTFDYASSKIVPSENSSTSAESNGEVSAKNECRCQAANCRKIMFSLPENQVIAPFLKTSQED